MSAAIIAFPARRSVAATKTGQYDFLYRATLAAYAEARAREALPEHVSGKHTPEKEILTLLRCIDRRLAKISAA